MAFDPNKINILNNGDVWYGRYCRFCQYDTCALFRNGCDYALNEETKDHIHNAFQRRFPNDTLQRMEVKIFNLPAMCHVKKLKLIEAIQKYL